MPPPQPYIPQGPLSTGGRPLPEGVENGTYALRPQNSGTMEIDIREFIGWWKTEQANFVRRVKKAAPDLIKLFIASLGGYAADALAIRDFLKMYPARVEVTITGTTASAATLIADAGDAIRMSDNALFLAHYCRGGLWAWGPVETLEKAAGKAVRGLHKHNEVIRGLYRKRTGRSDEDLDELLLLDEWLTAEEALDWGFIDEVFEPEPEADDDETDAATAYAPSPDRAIDPQIFAAYGLPRPPRRGHRPVAGENFAAWSNRLINVIDEDEDDDRSRADVITELAEATNLSAGIVRAIINEEDPIDCPFTSAEKFPTPADSRDAVRTWAGVLDASPRDAFAALEADDCTYDDDDGDEDGEAEDVQPNTKKPIAMSKPTDPSKTKPDKPDASHPDASRAQEQPDRMMDSSEPQRLAQMQADLAALKAENARLAEARRAASLASLRTALAGKVPGSAAEALVELAEAADKAASGKALVFEKAVGATPEKVETCVIDRLAAIASAMPELVTRGVIDTAVGGDGAGEEARAIAQATVKM